MEWRFWGIGFCGGFFKKEGGWKKKKVMGEDEHLRVSDGVWAAWRGTCFQEHGTAVHLVGKEKSAQVKEQSRTPKLCMCVLYHIHSFNKLGTFQVSPRDSILLVDKLQGMNHIYDMRMTFPAPICTIPKRSQINRRN